jgi:hypothetical protein
MVDLGGHWSPMTSSACARVLPLTLAGRAEQPTAGQARDLTPERGAARLSRNSVGRRAALLAALLRALSDMAVAFGAPPLVDREPQ